MNIIRFENGMTVSDLKKIVLSWSDCDEHGEPCEVWLDSGNGISNVVKEICPLNLRENDNGTKKWSDILLSCE